MRILLLLLLSVLALPAKAQDRTFPLDKSYNAISISGFDVQKMALTMMVQRAGKDDAFRGAGHAGCNNWSAGVLLNGDQIDFAEIVTTKKLCPKSRMKAEDAFLTALKSAKHWRVDGDKLIIEGDAARLLLKAGGPPVRR